MEKGKYPALSPELIAEIRRAALGIDTSDDPIVQAYVPIYLTLINQAQFLIATINRDGNAKITEKLTAQDAPQAP